MIWTLKRERVKSCNAQNLNLLIITRILYNQYRTIKET